MFNYKRRSYGVRAMHPGNGTFNVQLTICSGVFQKKNPISCFIKVKISYTIRHESSVKDSRAQDVAQDSYKTPLLPRPITVFLSHYNQLAQLPRQNAFALEQI